MKRKNTETTQLKNQLARALADYDNLYKRTEKEKEAVVRYANQDLVEKLLPVLELLEKVKMHVSDPGLDLAINNVWQVIKDVGIVEVLPALGETFDETRHEVVEVVTADHKPAGTIAEVVGKGIAWEDGRLIIPAKVKVYGEISEKEDELKKETMRGDYA